MEYAVSSSHYGRLVERIHDAQKLVDEAQIALQEIIREVSSVRQNHEYGIAKVCAATEPLLQCALQQVAGGGLYVGSALRTLTDAPDVKSRVIPLSSSAPRLPTIQAGSKYVTHLCEGRQVTSLVLCSPDVSVELSVAPQKDFTCLHRDIRPRLGSIIKTKYPSQHLLLPLVTVCECSVGVERPSSSTASSGFTLAAILGLASKLLRAFEKKSATKGVFVTRASKVAVVTDILSVLPLSVCSVNLLSGERPAPPSESHPRLVVCSAKDFLESNAIRTDDIDHLVIDDCNEATQQIFANNRFCKLRDVVYRGPAAALRQLPSPLSAKYHARLWSSERTVNVFDVQPFTMAKQIEELFASFPPGRNYLLTTQTNVFLQNVTVVATLDALPEDVDHLVVVDLPLSPRDLSSLLAKAAARFVTVVCSPFQRPALVDALKSHDILLDDSGVNHAPSQLPSGVVHQGVPRY